VESTFCTTFLAGSKAQRPLAPCSHSGCVRLWGGGWAVLRGADDAGERCVRAC
jgi:hypothetical protein